MKQHSQRALAAAFIALIGISAAVLLSSCASRPMTTTAGLPTRFSHVFLFGSASAHSEPEEIWILARSSRQSLPVLTHNEPVAPSASDESPGTGSLLAQIEDKEVPMPLKHTGVKASISGYIGTVDVTQQFHNPYDQKIEAVYVFPLPHDAAVNDFIMTIGDRRIRGIVRERKEAEILYAQARRHGYVASLLTEQRPNVFRQSVANIEPGKQIDVSIKYFHTLEYVDGWYEFVFPMVVGPRFNPPGSTDGIGAVARGESGASGQSTEVHYLKPGERSGHDISLRLELNAGVQIEDVVCRTHDILEESSARTRRVLTLRNSDSLPNRDFVLRYRVAGGQIKTSLLTHHTDQGGYFTLMLFPPEELGSLKRQPLELVFVLDCSGSMSGRPIHEAKAAIARGLCLLQPGDSFQLINFSTRASQLGPHPLEATAANVQRGLRYLESLNSEGGTMMIEGIKAALDFPHDPERLRFVCFLTDGYIGNETDILAEIHNRLGQSRIFSFGIGSAVNRHLMDQMAKAGRGVAAYLGPQDSAAAVMEDFFNRISHPALTDITLDWGTMRVTDVFPRQTPDLFTGRPVILTGRFTGTPSNIRVTGKADGRAVRVTVNPDAESADAAHSGLPSVWARMKIADLAAEDVFRSQARHSDQIRQVALDYGLLSPFTAFIAVDSSRVTEGAVGTTVPVAVPVPEGVKYETTVPEN